MREISLQARDALARVKVALSEVRRKKSAKCRRKGAGREIKMKKNYRLNAGKSMFIPWGNKVPNLKMICCS